MNFDIESIVKNTDGPGPLRVVLITWPDDENKPTRERMVDVSAKNLRTFENFREVVADATGEWLDIRLTDFDGKMTDEKDDWNDLVKGAFEAGQRWAEDNAQAGGLSPEEIIFNAIDPNNSHARRYFNDLLEAFARGEGDN